MNYKKVMSVCLAAALIVSPLVQNMTGNYTAFAASDEEVTIVLPDELPTAVIPTGIADGDYIVPVYMYTSYADEASMGNGAIDHEATLTVENGIYTVTLGFHDMPFLDLYGHLEKLWYYDTDGNNYEVTTLESEWLYDDATKAKVKTIKKCSFVLPENSAEIGCRVKVDAMGDTEQDARLVFDFSVLESHAAKVDTTELMAKIAEAEAITNDDGKYTEDSFSNLQNLAARAQIASTAEDLTQEYADMFVTMIQDAINGLVVNNSSETTTTTVTTTSTATETTTTETTTEPTTTTLPSREDGIYSVSVKFVELETGNENSLLSEIYGNEAIISIEDT